MSDLPQPLKDLGKATLTKVADKFVDFVITKYTGKSIKVFEAEGDIEADKVKTKWELLEKPFWLQAEAQKMGRQYANLGNALLKTKDLITSSENNIKDDNDVFWGLLEHAKEVSNEEVQDLIAKIIAGEYNNPETYSMSTLQTLKSIGKKELELFEKISGLLLNNEQLPKDLFSGSENVKEMMSGLGLHFGSLQALQSLGLFLPNDMTRNISNPDGLPYIIDYFDEQIVFEPIIENNADLRIPTFYAISVAGKEILQHLKTKKVDGYTEWLKEHYSISNYKYQEILEVIDEDDKVVGLQTRSKIHKDGLLHREIHIWFITPQGEIIFQHRAKNKDTYPDKLDATVGGHVEPKMSYEETAVKECKEETGIDIDLSKLTFLRKMRKESFDEVTKLTNNTIRSQYAYLYEGPISDLKVEEGKAEGFEAWKIDDLPNLSEEDKKKFINLILSDDMLAIFKEVKNTLIIKSN